MSIEPNAPITLTGFSNAPQFAHGKVRDLRVRWALAEIDRSYKTELFDAMTPRPAEYREWQPFGQVPAFDDGQVRLFESGAILLYLGEQDERLLPRNVKSRWNATAWLIAALNSVEPMLMQIVSLDLFQADKPWAKDARLRTVEIASAKLKSVADALGDADWLAGPFTVADILMVTVLRNLDHTDILDGYPRLKAYKQRGEARPAFVQALAEQSAELGEPAKLEQPA